MRFIEDLCPPALLYLIFLVIQLGFDVSNGMYITVFIKLLIGVASVVVLDVFCGVGLGIFSWFLISVPFIITILATSISVGLKLDENIKEKFYEGKKFETVPAASDEIA